MRLAVNLDNHSTGFEFSWTPLQAGGNRCYLWECPNAGGADEDKPVVYRHVLEIPIVGIVTIYVGEGSSLNGPSPHHLKFQYGSGGHGKSRVKVRKYLKDQTRTGWTEILDLSNPGVNLANDRQRKFVQMIFIATYYLEHQKLVAQGCDVPEFLNDPH